jgi:hypothetical protein
MASSRDRSGNNEAQFQAALPHFPIIPKDFMRTGLWMKAIVIIPFQSDAAQLFEEMSALPQTAWAPANLAKAPFPSEV